MFKHRVLVVNAQAGGGKAARWLNKKTTKDFIKMQDIDVLLLEEVNALTDAIEQYTQEEKTLWLCAGGDGSYHHLVNTIAQHTTAPIHLCPIPLGTGSDLCRMYDWSDGIEQLETRIISHGRLSDLGCVEWHNREHVTYFLNSLSLGLPAMIGQCASQKYGRARQLKYICASFDLFARHVKTRYMNRDVKQSEDLDNDVFVMMNGQYFGGGMRIAPNAQNDDGLFDIVSVKRLGAIQICRAFPRLLIGRHMTLDFIQHDRSSAFKWPESDIRTVDLDGESYEGRIRQCRLLKQCLTIY